MEFILKMQKFCVCLFVFQTQKVFFLSPSKLIFDHFWKKFQILEKNIFEENPLGHFVTTSRKEGTVKILFL